MDTEKAIEQIQKDIAEIKESIPDLATLDDNITLLIPKIEELLERLKTSND